MQGKSNVAGYKDEEWPNCLGVERRTDELFLSRYRILSTEWILVDTASTFYYAVARSSLTLLDTEQLSTESIDCNI